MDDLHRRHTVRHSVIRSLFILFSALCRFPRHPHFLFMSFLRLIQWNFTTNYSICTFPPIMKRPREIHGTLRSTTEENGTKNHFLENEQSEKKRGQGGTWLPIIIWHIVLNVTSVLPYPSCCIAHVQMLHPLIVLAALPGLLKHVRKQMS